MFVARLWRDRLTAALAIAVAYYAGAHIGALLKIPPSTPSAIWPPNAILLAALLIRPPRDWWWLLLSALPSHLAVELQFGWPTSLVLALFVTNCFEALVGAIAVRALSDDPTRFDSLARMAAFIAGGALLAPIVSSFADAGVVALLRGDQFWMVWRARTFSNILAALVVVPSVVACVREGPRWLTRARPRVHIEAVLMVIVTTVIAAGVFEAPVGSSLIPGSPRTPVAFLLPCFLWAAVRFGPTGISVSLLSTALVASWAGTHGRGPFYGFPPADAVLALQLYLSVMAIPLLCLGALIQERWRTEAELADRLAFEQLLSRMSGAFVLAPGRGVDDTAAIWLGKLAVYLRVDCAWLLIRPTDAPTMSLASSWVAPGVPVVSTVDPLRDLGWVVSRTLDAAPVVAENVETLSADERTSMRRLSVRALLAMPIGAGGRVLGALVLASSDGPRPWPDVLRARLRLVSEVFAGALARQAADAALRAGEAMKSAILASLSTGVAVLDRTGRIVAVNERWTALAHDQHEIVTGEVSLGANYLELCLMASMQGAPHAGAARAGIEAVLGRSRSTFTLEYETDGPAGERWAVLSVVPLSSADGGAVVTHTDITERRRAELEAQRSR
ncbi:MAG TPA: MASE1 domain-containing protein, partial [Chloroflexota bacterium]|nr:MASE1 domain-containing protein [Chloroflexota bacterium]